MIPPSYSKLPTKFWSQVKPVGECLIWTGSTRDGYGLVWVGAKRCSAHRVAYKDKHGELPEELDHTCPNKACIHHVEPVTHAENMKRWIARGGMPGYNLGTLPLADDVVQNIKTLRRDGLTYVQIGKRLGISKSAAHKYANQPL